MLQVADFGVATRSGFENTFSSDAAHGTIRYMAPEVLFGKYNLAADTYSFALLAWEIVHEEVPFKNATPIAAVLLTQNGTQPQCEVPAKCAPALAALLARCWGLEPASRPLLSEVVAEVEQLEAQQSAHAAGGEPTETLKSIMSIGV